MRTNWVGEPWALLAAMLTVTVPPTVEPAAGLVIEAVKLVAAVTLTVTLGGLTLLSPRSSSTVSETM